MKNIIFTVCFLLGSLLLRAQDFHGVAYYASQTQMKDLNITIDNITPAMKEQMMEKMKKALEKIYILNFNKIESLYHEEEKLDQPNPSNGGLQVNFSGGNSSKLYKNLKLQQIVSNQDIFGKDFLVTDALEKFDWKYVNEQKVIGNYTCSKAQIIIPVTENDRKEYQEDIKQQEKNKTTFFNSSEPKERIIEAWYTLEIPVSNGPSKYWGLPGLILELHEGSTTLLCTKIILNPTDKTEIKAPKNGKKVNQKEFDEIEEKKLKSMTNEDGAIEIRIN